MRTSSRVIDLLKSVDAVLGIPLARRLGGPRREVPAEARDVLLVRLWGLGNLALLAPVLSLAPARRLRLLTLERNRAFVARRFPAVGLLGVPEPVSPRFLPAVVRHARSLRRDPPEVVVDAEAFLRLPLLLARTASGAPAVGLDTPGQHRAPLLDHALPHVGTRHVGETFVALARAAGLHPADGPGPLHADPARGARLADRFAPGCGPVVVLHPGTGDHFPGRRWPPERFGALARDLVRRARARVVVTGVPHERPLVRRVVAASGGAAHGVAGRLDVDDLLDLLAHAGLLVAADTGPVHLADAVGTPVVALYGPNTPHRYGPRQPGSAALSADLPCSPCLDDRFMKRSSCRHHACMEALGLHPVAAACLARLGHATGRPPSRTERHAVPR